MQASSPSLEEINIVELVEFDAELEGGLQVAHGARGVAGPRARGAECAMIVPTGPPGACRSLHTAHRTTADHTRRREPPQQTRAATGVRLTVRLSSQRGAAPQRVRGLRATAPPALPAVRATSASAGVLAMNR